VAHLLPPSTLVLSDDGDIGVRTVSTDNRVSFKPVSIIADTRNGIWVDGLPLEVTIITVGQEYVGDGALVEPVLNAAMQSDRDQSPDQSQTRAAAQQPRTAEVQ
jgi:multidrug efflux system membrane fusion protein